MKLRPPQLALSILSCDFTCLGEQLKEALEYSESSVVHLDIMDGLFVPNISFGPGVVKQINQITDRFLDVHLMIVDPDRYINAFAEAGSDLISVHVEACTHLHRTLQAIKGADCRAGVAINPATPLASVETVLDMVDQVILMSVNPGFGGQEFIPNTWAKLEKLVELCKKMQVNPVIEIDGGVNAQNIKELVNKGAERLVVGSAVFKKPSEIKTNLIQIESNLA